MSGQSLWERDGLKGPLVGDWAEGGKHKEERKDEKSQQKNNPKLAGLGGKIQMISVFGMEGNGAFHREIREMCGRDTVDMGSV